MKSHFNLLEPLPRCRFRVIPKPSGFPASPLSCSACGGTLAGARFRAWPGLPRFFFFLRPALFASSGLPRCFSSSPPSPPAGFFGFVSGALWELGASLRHLLGQDRQGRVVRCLGARRACGPGWFRICPPEELPVVIWWQMGRLPIENFHPEFGLSLLAPKRRFEPKTGLWFGDAALLGCPLAKPLKKGGVVGLAHGTKPHQPLGKFQNW